MNVGRIHSQSSTDNPSCEQLLLAVGDILSQAITSAHPEVTYAKLLETLIDLTASDFGFIGETVHTADRRLKLTVCATVNRNTKQSLLSKKFDHSCPYIECSADNSFIGSILNDPAPVICNEITAAHKIGSASFHPHKLKNFVGLPVLYGEHLVGIIGAANRNGGYSTDLPGEMKPLASATGHVIVGQQHSRALSRLDQARRLANAIQTSQLEQSQDGIIVAAQDGRIYSCNEVFRQQWGVSREDSEHWNLSQLTNHLCKLVDRPEELRVRLEETLHVNNECLTGKLDCKDGRTFQMHGAPIVDEFDTHHGRTWYFRELTAQLRNERNLAEARSKAEDSNRAKTEFLSNMSHEIRTPLTAILGYTDILEAELESPDHVEFLRSIHQNGEFLLHLIDDILDVSKIESGKFLITPSCFNVHRLLDETVELLQFRAKEQHNKLELWADESVPQVIETDRVRLRQILVNLIGNAIKFTEKGIIQVRAWADTTGSHAQGDHQTDLYFQVTDTGVGMSPEHLQRVFRMFNQADNSLTRKHGGIGLGLALCRRLTGMLGGTISVSSQESVGSRFTFSIKAKYHDTEFDPQSLELSSDVGNGQLTARVTQRLHGARILFADDSPANRRAICERLQEEGAHVQTASNGSAALGQILSHGIDAGRFDLVLLDTQMPIVDGYTTATRLREAKFSKPILAVSNGSSEGESSRCISSGFNECLSKPVSTDAPSEFEPLICAIESYLHANIF